MVFHVNDTFPPLSHLFILNIQISKYDFLILLQRIYKIH